VRRLVLVGVVAAAAAALYRRAQEMAEEEDRPLADVVSDLPARLWHDLGTITGDLRSAAEEGVAAAHRTAESPDFDE
jgi:hypothetical protein